MSEIALPTPDEVTLARVSEIAGQAAIIRARCLAEHDLGGAQELLRRLNAYHQYVSDRTARKALAGEQRLAELLVGQLLGPPRQGERTDLTSATVAEVAEIGEGDRGRFRALAREPELVAELVEAGVTQRSKILQAIERDRLTKVSEQPRQEEPGQPLPRWEVGVAGVEAAKTLIPPSSIDAIVTDPPYEREAIEGYADLAYFAAHALRDGGILAVMCGQFHLPEAIEALMCHPDIHYHWTLAYLTPGGQAPQIFPRKVNTFWKPVVWLVKGDYEGDWVGDVARSDVNANEKTRHKWGQSESGMTDLIDRLTRDGDLICDPYCGAGTTGVAALSLDRRFIGFDIDPAEVAVARGRLAEC